MGKRLFLMPVFGIFALLSAPYVNYMLLMHNNNGPCIFCQIAGHQIPETKLVANTSEIVIFKDIRPASKYHYLAIPKHHISHANKLTKDHLEMVKRMESELRQYFTSNGIDTNDALFGFHLPPFISVKHLHMHAIAPRSTMGILQRAIFLPGTMWFKEPKEIIAELEKLP